MISSPSATAAASFRASGPTRLPAAPRTRGTNFHLIRPRESRHPFIEHAVKAPCPCHVPQPDYGREILVRIERCRRASGGVAAAGMHEAELFRKFLADSTRREVTSRVRDARTAIREMSQLISAHPTGSGIQVRLNWIPDEKNAAGMQEIVALMAKDAPLDSERERLQEFFRARLAAVRAAPDADYTEQMRTLLDYRLWWRFTMAPPPRPRPAVGDAN